MFRRDLDRLRHAVGHCSQQHQRND